MPATSVPDALLCHYHYNALDQLIGHTLLAQPLTQRFYHKDRLTSEIQGDRHRSVFQHGEQVLAERGGATTGATLLGTDRQRSTLIARTGAIRHYSAYTAHGYSPAIPNAHCLLGFNGERADPVTGHYLLGNGYRVFNPVLLRFNRPDSLSPFGEGGLNPYAYCAGDPVNRNDPTGHMSDDAVWGVVFAALGFTSALIGLPALLKTIKSIKSRTAKLHDFADLVIPVAGAAGGAIVVARAVKSKNGEDPETLSRLMYAAGFITSISTFATLFKAGAKAFKAVKRRRHQSFSFPDVELVNELTRLPKSTYDATIKAAQDIRNADDRAIFTRYAPRMPPSHRPPPHSSPPVSLQIRETTV